MHHRNRTNIPWLGGVGIAAARDSEHYIGAIYWSHIGIFPFSLYDGAGCSVFHALNSGKREYVHCLQDKSRLVLCAVNGEWRIVCIYLG